MGKGNRGFASMDPELRRKFASKGGKKHSIAHMRKIGQIGGIASGIARNIKKDWVEIDKMLNESTDKNLPA